MADTHLGAGGFGNKLSSNGINQREEDICRAFTRAVDKTIELEPDFVIHAGDLFHMVRPTNRIINFAIKEIIRLTQADIPVVIISGNHDAPKQRSVGHVLSIFENLKDVYPIFKSKYEVVKLKDVAIGCLPHCLTPEILQEQFEQVRPELPGLNILVAHGVAAGVEKFSMAEISEEEIPSSVMGAGFDYVALGHYHRYTNVQKGVFYAGSTERLSFGELGEDKGIMEVEIPGPVTKFHQLPVRDMIELERIDARGMDYDQLEAAISSALESVELTEKIVRLKITSLTEALYNNLPVRDIKSKTSDAFFFKLIAEREEAQAVHLEESMKFGRLLDEFKDYLENRPIPNLDRGRLMDIAEKYFSDIEE
jgi:DNA repair exonuclease SbcCD nuclease subunit